MKPILIAYATHEGQARRVAGHLVSTLGGLGRAVECCDVVDVRAPLHWESYGGCILVASVHRGEHQREMVDFVKGHRRELGGLPSVFLSVCMAEAVVEDAAHTAPERERAAREAQTQIQRFFDRTGWTPTASHAVAGSIAYSQYGFVMRHVMKRIASKAGLSTDTSRDHQYTDWGKVEDFAREFHSSLGQAPRPAE